MEVVRFVEVARLLELARSGARFTQAIANAVVTQNESGEPRLDYQAPDRLLGQRPGTLAALRQYRYLEPQHATEIAAAMAMRRMNLVRGTGATRLGQFASCKKAEDIGGVESTGTDVSDVEAPASGGSYGQRHRGRAVGTLRGGQEPAR